MQVPVWDIVVRLFHWSLVAAFAMSWFTQEQFYELHLITGYTTLGLICLRTIWGFTGPQHARFSDFVYSPATVHRYLASMISGKTRRYLGHNPAAGLMVLVMLICLFIVTVSGIALDGAENWSGPMAEMQLFHYTAQLKTLHAASSDMLLALIAVHILGVIVTSWQQRENLVSAMITGKKRRR